MIDTFQIPVLLVVLDSLCLVRLSTGSTGLRVLLVSVASGDIRRARHRSWQAEQNIIMRIEKP